jgi:cytochrome c5
MLTARADDPGLYSKAQAKQGGTTFGEKCQACHDPAGGSWGPSLKGESFWEDWNGKPARALYSKIISTMPPDDPGSIPEKDVINLVSFIMQLNELPGGDKTIQNADELNKIKLEKPK